MDEIKEKVLRLLEKKESAFDRLDDLWRDEIDTTGITTVRELFERYENKKGPLTQDDLKDLLRDLAYVNITRHVFPQTRAISSASCAGSPFGNSVASALEGSSAKSAAAGFQSSPAKVMVTGRDQLRVKLPPKPSSHDWCPVKTSGTMEELVQNMREENEQLKSLVHQLEEALEREKKEKLHCQSQVRHLQQEVLAKDGELRNQSKVMHVVMDELRESKRTAAEEQLARERLEAKLQRVTEQMKTKEERYDEKFQELENQLQEKQRLMERVTNLQQQLAFEKSYREQAQQQLEQRIVQFQGQLQQYGEEYQRQLQQGREECQRRLQQESANLQHQYRQQIAEDRARLDQHLQHVERVAEERCARHQQPETRTWIIQRNDVVLCDEDLGQGSWGIVRKGTFRGSPVAVKKLHNLILSPHNRRLFEREMEISSQCRHFNIVQFMGATSDDQDPLLVTELLDGNLRQLLERRQLNRGEIVSLALDVARGLNYMHCNQPPIVHRDVKSDNVLLKRWDKSWIAKVSDFGAANFHRLVMTPSQGTPLYSAPESNTAGYSELVDVYSFGLLLLEMCIREYPVLDEIHRQIQHVPCPRLQDLIGRCVEQAPERRPKMDEVIQILTQLM